MRKPDLDPALTLKLPSSALDLNLDLVLVLVLGAAPGLDGGQIGRRRSKPTAIGALIRKSEKRSAPMIKRRWQIAISALASRRK